MMPLLTNHDAKRLFLHTHGLAQDPSLAADLGTTIRQIGFVQLDSINTLARAHDMILWSRQRSYLPHMLKDLLEQDRSLFEHWTHDASVIPMEFFPHWRHRFTDHQARLDAKKNGVIQTGFAASCAEVIDHITRHGPAMTRHLGRDEVRGSGGWWDWSPSKAALEGLWRSGTLSIAGRDGFQKIYDLTHRVIPDTLRSLAPVRHESEDWANEKALDHLGFATPAQIAAFWAMVPVARVRKWAELGLGSGALIMVQIAAFDGSLHLHLMRPKTYKTVAKLPDPVKITRLLSPFDPILRDRARALKLFGFNYRIEVFVPKENRIYGYYVFPILKGDALIGRIDAKADRQNKQLNVRAFWPEQSVKPIPKLVKSLEVALQDCAAFAGLDQIVFAQDWLRSAP
jgi:uncharacterized protein